MTTGEVLHSFFSSFGITAYPANAVPEDTVFPWLTYEVVQSHFSEEPVSITVNLWYHTDSEAVPNAKVKEIADAIGSGGKQLICADGAIWVRRGSPWCTNISDENDSSIKRRYINITLEYLTI